MRKSIFKKKIKKQTKLDPKGKKKTLKQTIFQMLPTLHLPLVETKKKAAPQQSRYKFTRQETTNQVKVKKKRKKTKRREEIKSEQKP